MKLAKFMESQGAALLILTFLTLCGLGVWLRTGDKWVAEIFSAALLTAIQHKPGGIIKKEDEEVDSKNSISKIRAVS